MSHGPIPGSQQRNERCQREFDLNYRQFCALVAAVSSFLLDGGPVTRLWVDKLVCDCGESPRYAGEELVNLARKALLVEVGLVENVVYYRPTPRAVDMVRRWAGAFEREAAAE
jgi:hypothetical protein